MNKYVFVLNVGIPGRRQAKGFQQEVGCVCADDTHTTHSVVGLALHAVKKKKLYMLWQVTQVNRSHITLSFKSLFFILYTREAA